MSGGTNEPPNKAVSLEVFLELSRTPELMREYESAHCPWERLAAINTGLVLSGPSQADVNKKMTGPIVEGLKSGRIISWARVGSPTAPWSRLPPDSWDYLNPNFSNSTAWERSGLKYFSVRVLSVENRHIVIDASTAKTPTKKRRGRKPGSGKIEDSGHLRNMRILISSGEARSVNAAAEMIADDAEGLSRAAKVARLRRKYAKTLKN